MFEQFPVSDLTAVGNAVAVPVQAAYGRHQITVATFDSNGAAVVAGAGTFGLKFRAHSGAALEDVADQDGTAITIDATAPRSVELQASCVEIVITPAGVTTATHYRAFVKSGN